MKNTPISLLKNEAKKIKKDTKITHIESLDLISKKYGFDCWNTLIDNSVLKMNYKTIAKLNVAKPKLAFLLFDMLESLKEVNIIFNQKDPFLMSNFLGSRFNSSYNTQNNSLQIIKLISIVYTKNTDIFNPKYLKQLLNFDFLLKEINKDYEFYNKNDFIQNFFYTKLNIKFDKNMELRKSYYTENWFAFVSGYIDTIDALIDIQDFNLLKADFKILSLKIKETEFLELLLNNNILNSTNYFEDYFSNARQRNFRPTFNIFNLQFLKTNYLIDFEQKDIHISGEKVTNANLISVKLLKDCAKRELKDKKNKLKNSKESLNFIANRYGYENWSDLINYLELPLYIKEKEIFKNDFSSFNGFFEDLKEIIDALSQAFNKKSYNAFFFIYKRLNIYSEVFQIDLSALKIIIYVFINFYNKLDFKKLIELFNIDYLLEILENNFKEDNFIKNSFYKEIFLELKDSETNLNSFCILSNDLKTIFDLIHFEQINNDIDLLHKLSQENVFNELINNQLIIEYKGYFEYYKKYLIGEYKDEKISEINSKIISNYQKYY